MDEIGKPLVISPKRFNDERGYFSETWNKKKYLELGVATDFVQDNHSLSYKTGTVRGLHIQVPPKAQAKLVRCGRGSLFDVFVDIRKDSPTFGHWAGEVLSEKNGKQVFIPEGYLHGFITLEPNTEINYKCTSYYSPKHERSIRFDDPDIAIKWPIEPDLKLVSQKDFRAIALKNFNNPFKVKG